MSDYVRLETAEKYRAARDEVLDTLLDVIVQACETGDGFLDSMALSAYADAIEVLRRHGRVEVIHRVGRRSIARVRTVR